MRQCDLKLKTYMENKGLWQNSNSSTPSSFMQIYGDPRKKTTTKQNQKEKKKDFQYTLLLLVMERMAIQILVRHTAGKILSLVHIGQKFRLIFSEIFFSGSVQYIFI